MGRMDATKHLTEQERVEVAAVLERMLEDVAAGELEATGKQRAFIAGVIMGIRGEMRSALTLREPLV